MEILKKMLLSIIYMILSFTALFMLLFTYINYDLIALFSACAAGVFIYKLFNLYN